MTTLERILSRGIRGSVGERGQALVEFALVTPVLLSLLIGGILFGIAMNNYLTLTNAANISTQQLSISRGQTTDPCATAVSAFTAAAPDLTASSLTFSFVLNGTAESGTTCTSGTADLVQGKSVEETVTYPCNLNIAGFNPAPSCKLTASLTEIVQ